MKLSQLATTVIIAITSTLFNPLGLSSVLAEDVYVNQPQRPVNGRSLTLKDAFYLIFIVENSAQYGSTFSEADKKAISEDMPKVEDFLEKNNQKIDWYKICKAYQIAEDWKRAINTCKQRLEFQESILEKGQVSGELGVNDPFTELAMAYIGAGEYDNAINYLNKGIDFSKEWKSPTKTDFKFSYLFFRQLARVYFKLGNYDESLNYSQQALDRLLLSNEEEYRCETCIESDFADEVSSIKSDIAFALLRRGNLDEAEKSFIEAMNNDEQSWKQTITNLLSLYRGGGGFWEGSLINTVSIYPYGLQELKVKQGKYNEALEFAEKGKTRILSYLISKQSDTSITIPEIQQLARDKNATIVKYSWLQNPVPNSGENTDYSSQIYIWVIQPSGKINFSQVDLSQPLNSQQTQGQSLARGININNNSSMKSKLLIPLGILLIGFSLSYFLLRHRKPLMIVAITASCLTSAFLLFQQNQTPSFNIDSKTLVQLTKQTFATVRSNNRDTLSDTVRQKTCENQNQCLDNLSQIIIAPIAKFLPKNPEETVIFIPDGELFRVPFAALKTPDGKYLIENHTVQISPSIQTLQLINQQSSNNVLNLGSNALIVGNPTMPKMENGEQLPALPGTEKEAKAISQMLGTQPLIGEQADIQTVIQQMPNVDIIHLATHGNSQSIALAPAEGQTGFLSGEIYGMKLHANLVVLSACDTGLGDITSDGVVGIARPFLAAGVKSVVVSLWSVPDAPTSDLMIEFYNNLKTQPNKAKSLRKAMLTVMEQHPEPVNWAGFMLVGEAE